MSAILTIVVFLLAEVMNLGFYLVEIFGEFNDDNSKLLYQIPILISQFMLMTVLFYYTFEIKIVLLKVKSETPQEYSW
jgi:hypothetical protein